MAGESPTLTTVRFGPFELSRETAELRKDGVRLKLSGQPIQVLIRLIATPGKLVTREELQQQLWPGNTYGDFEKGLNAAVTRLRTYLNDSATEPKYIETVPGRGYRFIAEVQGASDRSSAAAPRVAILIFTLLALVFGLGGFQWYRARSNVRKDPPTSNLSVAVLPLQNSNSDKSDDFLQLALADEIATNLSHVQSFSVRPSSHTTKYRLYAADLQQAGRDMGATTIVTGYFQSQNGQIEATLEAFDAANSRILWRDTIIAPTTAKLAMREQIELKVQQGLVPALGGTAGSEEAGTRPSNEEAYDLYLRGIATFHDPDGNRKAISMLERSVAIDPGYAPVWEELGFRYYYEGALFDGGQRLLNLSDSSFERALLLDPNLISSAAFLIVNRTERGEIANASAEAVALVRRRPQSALAHFLMAYILRYAGLLEDAAHECQTAVSLDRHNSEFRSCAWTYMQLNRPQMAMQFVRLDEASEWSARATAYILLGQGKLVEALQTIQKISLNRQRMNVDLFEACFDTSKRSALDGLSLQAESTALADSDPEDRYILGSLLLRCGEKDAALRLIRSALEHNYCAYTALQTDPLLEELRRGEVYNALVAIANDCQSKFVNGLKHSSP